MEKEIVLLRPVNCREMLCCVSTSRDDETISRMIQTVQNSKTSYDVTVVGGAHLLLVRNVGHIIVMHHLHARGFTMENVDMRSIRACSCFSKYQQLHLRADVIMNIDSCTCVFPRQTSLVARCVSIIRLIPLMFTFETQGHRDARTD